MGLLRRSTKCLPLERIVLTPLIAKNEKLSLVNRSQKFRLGPPMPSPPASWPACRPGVTDLVDTDVGRLSCHHVLPPNRSRVDRQPAAPDRRGRHSDQTAAQTGAGKKRPLQDDRCCHLYASAQQRTPAAATCTLPQKLGPWPRSPAEKRIASRLCFVMVIVCCHWPQQVDYLVIMKPDTVHFLRKYKDFSNILNNTLFKRSV